MRVGIFIREVNRRTTDVPAAIQNQFRLKVFNRWQQIFFEAENRFDNAGVFVYRTISKRRGDSRNVDYVKAERRVKLRWGGVISD